VERKPSYNPTVGQPLTLDNLFGRDEWIAKNGISVNEDGSTNNLTDYYRYCRDTWIKSLDVQFFAWTAWGFVCGAFVYYSTYFTMGGPISTAGQTNDYWNSGVVIYSTMVFCHHVMVFCETFHWNAYIVPAYLFSFGLFFLVINMNENFQKSVYQGNQWSMIFASPLTYLTVVMHTIFIYGPRYLIKTISHIVWYPEFTKIKGA
jgi:hypothetical protein